MRAARISHVRSACEVGIGCARATNVYLVITGPSVLSTPAGVFTKDYFAFWIFIAVIWALVASFIIIALPIWESKDQILAVFDGIFHTNLCEYYNPETSKQHKLHTAAAAAEPAKAAEPVS